VPGIQSRVKHKEETTCSPTADRGQQKMEKAHSGILMQDLDSFINPEAVRKVWLKKPAPAGHYIKLYVQSSLLDGGTVAAPTERSHEVTHMLFTASERPCGEIPLDF
jgi:hypothetical protein